MRLAPLIAAPLIALAALAGSAQAGTVFRQPAAKPLSICAPNSYSVTNSPDGTAISIIFDNFALSGGASRMNCLVQAPLHLPDGYSLGLYRVDYRGFAHLEGGQSALLSVDYSIGKTMRTHNFRHVLLSPQDGDFSFSEIVPPGLMTRTGCGDSAVLMLLATLEIPSAKPSSMITLDSIDGAPAVTYRFDLKKCGT